MTAPIRIQLSRAKGWCKPPNTVSVARPGPFGNPFKVGEDVGGRGPVDQAGAVQMFKDMLADPELRAICGYPADLSSLRGKNLACWCKPGEPCHADVLIELANADA